MKYYKLIGVILLLLSLIACGNTTDTKEEQKVEAEVEPQIIHDTYQEITDATKYSLESSNIILTVWDTAISKGFDFDSVFKYMFSGDVKNHEWSGLGMDTDGFSSFSWGSIATDMNNFKSRLDKLNEDKVKVDEMMQQIKDIDGEDYKEKISKLTDYYSTYKKIYNTSTNPSGNKLNYSDNLIDLNNEFEETKIKIEMLVE
ncbi:hypothetical protein GWK91_11050 [Virgibacillus sp. MSP4-1]|uniref:hypothetical protein n=1 Tax=Virgibacillus sp. MSP4-1 TaxID=2700081 RepID=UPI00039BFA68|nr:hypothetical protein [Virgibacillus sp. MSP4-1]QHS23460.1 hypothetical protein GWK91_11050 [Virgibacillus sp. MSP4-1]